MKQRHLRANKGNRSKNGFKQDLLDIASEVEKRHKLSEEPLRLSVTTCLAYQVTDLGFREPSYEKPDKTILTHLQVFQRSKSAFKCKTWVRKPSFTNSSLRYRSWKWPDRVSCKSYFSRLISPPTGQPKIMSKHALNFSH